MRQARTSAASVPPRRCCSTRRSPGPGVGKACSLESRFAVLRRRCVRRVHGKIACLGDRFRGARNLVLVGCRSGGSYRCSSDLPALTESKRAPAQRLYEPRPGLGREARLPNFPPVVQTVTLMDLPAGTVSNFNRVDRTPLPPEPIEIVI